MEASRLSGGEINLMNNSADPLQEIVDKVTGFTSEYIVIMNEANAMLGRIVEEQKSLGKIHARLESLRDSVTALIGDVWGIRSDVPHESKAITASMVSELVMDLSRAAWRLRNFRGRS